MKTLITRSLLLLLMLTTFSSVADIPNGRYAIVSRLSGLALDVASQSTSNGANIQQWSYHHGTNQQFDVTDLGNGYYSIRPAHSAKSLDVWDFSTDTGERHVPGDGESVPGLVGRI